MKLSALIENIRDVKLQGPDTELLSLVVDSRKAGPGACFIAVKGAAQDGHVYIPKAVENGVAALIVDDASLVPEGFPCAILPSTRKAAGRLAAKFYSHPSSALWVCGITGTNGKTSTSYLAEKMLQMAGYETGVVGTINYRFGNESREAPTTTPGPIDWQALMAEMRDAGVSHVLAEISSHALDQHRADGTQFDCAVFTNLSRDHLDYHADMQSYAFAKRRLFADLLQQSEKPDVAAVVNIDDEAAKIVLDGYERRLFGVSLAGNREAAISVQTVHEDLDGTRIELTVDGEALAMHTALIGRHNAANAIEALGIGIAAGLSPKVAVEGIASCRNVPGRLERIDNEKQIHCFVDYSHTPDALEHALSVLKGMGDKRLIVVFGCGGDRDRGKRPLMGKVAGAFADVAILTSDNPRTEDPFGILAEVEKGLIESGMKRATDRSELQESKGYRVLEPRREAIEEALSLAEAGDIVLIAGKGHEDYQIVGNKKLHFDDREEAAFVLKKLGETK